MVMQLPVDVDKDVQYVYLNCSESIDTMILIFEALGIDIDKYYREAVNNIDKKSIEVDFLNLRYKNTARSISSTL